MFQRRSLGIRGTVLALLGAVTLAACDTEQGNVDAGEDLELGEAEQAIAACPGDDPLYDYNALAASLAVAIGKDLGRWDANADLTIKNGKLELSTTGAMRCGTGCANTIALLRLQDDASQNVPNHSPSIYRQKLTGWYTKQTQELAKLVDQMLHVEKGIYKLKVRHSGKYMAVDNSSTSDGAVVEQQSSVSSTGADQWRLVLQGTAHQLVNVRSGKCLTMSSDSSSNGVTMVQKSCVAGSTVQAFDFAKVDTYWAIRTKYGTALDVAGSSTSNDAKVQQYLWSGPATNQQWTFEPVGTGAHISPTVLATAVYSLSFRHSNLALAVDAGSLADNALIEQATYSSTDDRFNWYVSEVNDKYQFINRRSGKCIALASDSSTAGLVQKTCANVNTQLFSVAPVGDGYKVFYSKYNMPMEVQGSSTSNDARVIQAPANNWTFNRQLKLTPVIAGEPHRLTFSHAATGASCGGQYFWYDISQPNLQPLHSPADTFVQLIFAGGKVTKTGSDVNPFISQQVSGDMVAIDPTYGLNEGGTTTSGSCSATCLKVSSASIIGQCCSCNGSSKAFSRAGWNANTYLCQ